MNRAFRSFRRRVCLGIGLACLGVALDAGGASAQASLAVAPSQADAPLAPIALGFDRWLVDQLEAAGAGVYLLEDASSLSQALQAASNEGYGHLLSTRLASHEGTASVQLLLYAPDSRTILVGANAEAPTEQLGGAALDALQRLVQHTGTPLPQATPPQLADLVSTSAALHRLREGDLPGAFHAVQGKLAPTPMRLREEIVARARDSDYPAPARARLLVAMGDSTTAWTLIGRQARQELETQSPDLDLLVAAGEVMLDNDGVKEAREYFERVLALAPDHALALEGMAGVLEAEGDRAAAVEKLARVAELRPQDPEVVEELAVLTRKPEAAAGHWIEAGRRAALWLDATHAENHFEQAVATDAGAEGRANAARGELEERMGRPEQARVAYQRAVSGGVRTPVVLTALGRTEHRLGDSEAAARTLESALEIEPKHPGAMRELSVVYTDTGRAEEAVPLLREVYALDPADTATRMTLSRALRATGDTEEALALLSGESLQHHPRALSDAAELQAEQGDLEGATASLARAVDLDPGNATLRERLASLLEKAGDTEGAAAERQVAAALAAGSAEAGARRPRRDVAHVLSLDDLVTSFSMQLANSQSRVVASLGVREPGDWKDQLRRLVRPRSPDLHGIERGFDASLAARFTPANVDAAEQDGLSVHIERLFDFESDLSRDAETIATVNQILDVDGVFASYLIVDKDPQLAESCGGSAFAIETRLLLGRVTETASILSNVECLDGGFDSYGRWNYAAFVIYLAALLLISWPVIRGWGQLVVKIHVPERTNGFFSIHITRGSDKVKREMVGDRSKKAQGKRFDFLRRYERHMAGKESTFNMIPARQAPYTVTVSGPLKDARGEEIIGHFLEEQKVVVRRRRTTTLEFDFRPKEVAVEVTVKENGQPARAVRVGLQGDPSSVRYARDGIAYLYLGLGSYTVLVGSSSAAAQFDVEISSLDAAIPLVVEMGNSEGLVFSDCPDAVEPFLQSDLAAAAQALDAAGNHRPAHLLRADHYRKLGRGAEAARELEAAGEYGGAAMELAGESDFEGSAALYEEAGEMDRAGAAFRDAGEFEKAALCFEKVYDYGNALECWREAGNGEREMAMLEKLGEFMEAAQIARQMGDREQVIRFLQHIEPRHSEYSDACRIIAEMASESGDHDVAVAKFEEALSATGVDNASIETLEAYAQVLERAGRHEAALSAYEAIRRQDVSREDVATRIHALKQKLEDGGSQAKTQHMASAAPLETRYELLEEIGRGGMGVVYKARDKRLGRIVALKRLPDNLRDHPAAVQLFEREARAAASLNHVNIVTVFDAGEEDGTFFITMELLEGRPLNAILDAKGRIGARDTMRLGIQICAGLHYAHERRIVHRDVKTANLFFTREQVVKIMDFGIAKSMEEVRRSTTVIGGTPYYMAPEQAAGDASIDHRADLYALGVTLFQLCTGSLPFEDGDVSYKHRHEQPPDPRELNVNLPADLAREILSLMEKDPERRPANAAVVGARLAELLSQSGS